MFIYAFIVVSQLALAIFKVLEIKWVIENNIVKSVILFNIQTLCWLISTAWSIESFLKGDWTTVVLFLISGSLGKVVILRYYKKSERTQAT